MPLGDFLEKLEKPAVSAVLYVDADIPFRMLVEVMFTIGQRGVSRFLLATRNAAKTAPDRVHGFQLAFPFTTIAAYTAFLVRDGMAIKSLGENVTPGCQSAGPGLAVLKKTEGDFETLTACLAALKPAAERAAETRDVNPALLAIVANPDARYEDIIFTMQAALAAGVEDFQFKVPR